MLFTTVITDLFALPEHTGAMENWGLNVYEYGELLFDETSGDSITAARVATTVTHELAHQVMPGQIMRIK